MVAECFELADVVASIGVGVDVAVVVVGAELVEAGVGVGEQVPDDHQHGAADRDDDLLCASSAGEASVTGTEEGVGTGRRSAEMISGRQLPRVDQERRLAPVADGPSVGAWAVGPSGTGSTHRKPSYISTCSATSFQVRPWSRSSSICCVEAR